MHRWARLPNSKCRLPFANQGKHTSIFHCRKQREICCFCFPLVLFSVYIYWYRYIYIYSKYLCISTSIHLYISISIYIYMLPFQTENRCPCCFPYSSSKQKFVICLFVYEETNRSYPFANGLDRFAHLCINVCMHLYMHMLNPNLGAWVRIWLVKLWTVIT